MKSPAGKEKWRLFINKYENKVADFNFGTLIRTDASDEYTQFNTTFGRYLTASSPPVMPATRTDDHHSCLSDFSAFNFNNLLHRITALLQSCLTPYSHTPPILRLRDRTLPSRPQRLGLREGPEGGCQGEGQEGRFRLQVNHPHHILFSIQLRLFHVRQNHQHLEMPHRICIPCRKSLSTSNVFPVSQKRLELLSCYNAAPIIGKLWSCIAGVLRSGGLCTQV